MLEEHFQTNEYNELSNLQDPILSTDVNEFVEVIVPNSLTNTD